MITDCVNIEILFLVSCCNFINLYFKLYIDSLNDRMFLMSTKYYFLALGGEGIPIQPVILF